MCVQLLVSECLHVSPSLHYITCTSPSTQPPQVSPAVDATSIHAWKPSTLCCSSSCIT